MEESGEIRGETLGSCGIVKTLHVSGVGGPRGSGGSWQDVSGSGVPGEVGGGLCRPGDKDLEETAPAWMVEEPIGPNFARGRDVAGFGEEKEERGEATGTEGYSSEVGGRDPEETRRSCTWWTWTKRFKCLDLSGHPRERSGRKRTTTPLVVWGTLWGRWNASLRWGSSAWRWSIGGWNSCRSTRRRWSRHNSMGLRYASR